MLTRAQCEKAVTIRESVGCPERGGVILAGAKALMAAPVLASLRETHDGYGFSWSAVLRRVFNDLRAGVALGWKRLGRPAKYLPNRAFVLLQRAWFGPNFVTILAKGVRVCSY